MAFLISFIIIFVFAGIIWRGKRFYRELATVQFDREKVLKIERDFTVLKEKFEDSSHFFRFSTFTRYKSELEELRKNLKEVSNVFLKKETSELVKRIVGFEKHLSLVRESTIDKFYQNEKIRAQHIFSDSNGKDLLTDEQLKAVLCDDDRNLIIAGAGSGKTRVIDFKVRYLVNYKKVDPKKILLLSFTRKSASDLVKKISETIPDIEAMTIHSFCSQVIDKNGKILVDESEKELDLIVIKALAETLKDKNIYRLFDTFYGKFFTNVKPLIFYTSLDELREDLKKLNSKLINAKDRFGEIKANRAFKTLKGDYVRSIDERYIADFLYIRNIKYEYEKKYPDLDTPYFPDFYLPEYDIYLEHFAITSSGMPPAYFDNPAKYMEGIDWKRKLHAEKKTRMIESYSYLLNTGDASSYLSELLKNNGIEVIEDLESDDSYGKISREFCKIFTKFYNTHKLSGLSIEELKLKYPEQKYSLFLQIFEKFLSHLEEIVQNENKMDFNDLVIEAIQRFRENDARKFDYIIVDEFQDTSNLAMKLLDLVYSGNPDTAFLSVGDDWQSIYGFNGSDVTILSDYSKRYAGVTIQNLNSNFRSHSKIVELGKQFISKNPAQIRKNVVSKNNNFNESEIDFYSFEQMEEKIKAIPDNESIFVLYRYNADCPAMMGIFKDYFYLNKNRKPVRKEGCTKNISLMTIHASKGLEAQHVFMLFPDGVKRKFPSEIEDHFVFNMLKTKTDDFPFSEERRLMYVAITRAEQNLYFVSSRSEPNSIFWDELVELVSLK
jgi:DNA helicase-4